MTNTWLALLICIAFVSVQDVSSCFPGNLRVDDTAQIGDVIYMTNNPLSISGTCAFLNVTTTNTTYNVILKYNLRSENCYDRKQTIACNFDCEGHSDCTRVFTVDKIDTNTLEFPESSYSTIVTEFVTIGKRVFNFDRALDQAAIDDKDCDSNANYEIVPGGNGKFSVYNSGIVTNGTIDYDEQNTYTLTIRAINSGLNYTEVPLTIHVIDTDTKDPIFNHTEYYLNVTEEQLLSDATPIIDCYDQDLGIDATVGYSFKDKTNTSAYFTINSADGTLTQTQTIDIESLGSPTFTIDITCYQLDDRDKDAGATLVVQVLDINDHLPVFEPVTYHVTVTENAMGYITTVVATDKDQGINAVIYYELVNGSDAVKINVNTGVIEVGDPNILDRERYSDITVIIGAYDKDGNYSANNATLVISLMDQNDNNPKFQETQYIFRTVENKLNEFVGTVVAEDADKSEANYNVTYSITTEWMETTNPAKHFPLDIDAISGNVSISGTLQPLVVYIMIISGCDNPVNINERRCDHVEVLVVYNQNSTTPSEEDITMEIQENVPIGTLIQRLPISGDTYKLYSKDFEVDVASTMLRTKIELDRERNSSYDLYIEVSSNLYGDVGNISVHVEVLDMNDNVPRFIEDEYYITLPQDREHGDMLGNLNASDFDTGDNAKITFSFYQSSGFENVFLLNATSGSVQLDDSWWSESKYRYPAVYQLLAVATDSGQPGLYSTVPVVISHLKINSDSSVRVPTEVDYTVLNEQKNGIQRDIGVILQYVDVTISVTEATTPNTNIRSYVTIFASINDTVLQDIDLRRSVILHWSAIQEALRQYLTYSSQTSGSGLRTAEIALICVAVAVLVGGVMAIVVICRQWDNHVRNNQLYNHLSRRSTMYDSQELRMDFGEELQSQFSTFRGSPRRKLDEPQLEGSFGMGYVNATFVDDVGNQPKATTWSTGTTPRIPRWSTSDSLTAAMESLEDLTMRLNAEDSISRVTNMSRTRSMKSQKSQKSEPDIENSAEDQERKESTANGYLIPPADYTRRDSTEECNHVTNTSPDTKGCHAGSSETNERQEDTTIASYNKENHGKDTSKDNTTSVVEEATAF